MKHLDGRKLSIIIFAFYFSWLLSFLFEGRVIYALSGHYKTTASNYVFSAMAFHFAGLLLSGFFVKSIKVARSFLIGSLSACIAGSLVFFFPPSVLWNVSMSGMAFLTGIAVAAWGYYYKKYTLPGDRMNTAADVLIYSNLLMIMINFITINLLDYLGFALSICMLLIALYFTRKLPVERETVLEDVTAAFVKKEVLIKPLGLLCFFIVIISVNSGLMYQVTTPAFSQHEFLVSWYWAVPYILALYIMKNFLSNSNRAYILYIAIAMIGFCFIAFMILDRSAPSFLVVNTLMLGACGIYDLFWWSILGEMINLVKNPAKLLGLGLSANVLGVFIGGVLGKTIVGLAVQPHYISLIAFGIILITFMLLPVLNKELSQILRHHAYLTEEVMPKEDLTPTEKPKDFTEEVSIQFQLTRRETEIVRLLLQGRTYKMIAQELFLSENTIKTHIKNIYSKFDVTSKTELINLITLPQK